jgi:hypothetical protein
LALSASAQLPLNLPEDVSNLGAPGPGAGAFDPGGDPGHVWSNRPIQGQTFTTGDNPDGYILHAVSLQNEENTVNNTTGFTLRVGSVIGNVFTQIATEFANNAVSYVPNDFVTFSFSNEITLVADTLYAFEWDAIGAGFTTWNNTNDTYPDGEGYSSGAGGAPNDGALLFRDLDRVFHVDLEAVIPPALRVVDSSPADGEIVGAVPTVVSIDFNLAIDTNSLDADDLTVDGSPAIGFNAVDADTVEFTPPAGLTIGQHTIAITANEIDSVGNLSVEAFSSSFTIAGLATIVDSPASIQDAVSAELSGEVTDNGGDSPLVTIYYGDDDAGTVAANWDSSISVGEQAGVFTATVLSLDPGTDYFFRSSATNIAGESWAPATSTFTQPGAQLPVVVTEPATSITSSSAVLHGEVTDTGGQPPEVILYYGDDNAGTDANAWDVSIALGEKSGSFLAVVTQLDALTTYYYRASATNDAGTAWAATTGTFDTGELVDATVVINEIHYDPADPTSPAEFIELLNAGDQPQDLTGWSFDDGISYAFADGTTILPGETLVIAEDPATVLARFGADAVGPWTGGLSNKGERLRLRDHTNTTVDEVTYGLGFPWPTVGDDPGHSIELINPLLDNDLGGSWRASAGDPGPEQTFFVQGGQWNYFKGTQEPSGGTDAWRQIGFDDSTWFTGATSIGYGDAHVITTLGDMRGNYSTVYFRKEFNVADPTTIASLRLEAQFDDGINVWINGQHVAVSNVSGPELPNTAVADGAGENITFQQFVIPSANSLLEIGTNVIAVQLVNGSLAGSSDAWFDARLGKAQGTGDGPTPGDVNNSADLNAAPQMRQVNHSPQVPASGEDVLITIKATDAEGVTSVTLDYQLVDPGNYIRITDPAYQTSWTTVTMVDDGTGGDAIAGDGIYSVLLDGDLQTHRRLVRYRITATDGLGASVTGPFADDPQPNFAYFVYDGVPDWTGSLRPGVSPAETYSSEVMQQVAVYQLIANETDITNSQYNGGFNLVQFTGTFVYEGKVYDHILFRNRGRASTYQVGKNKWKVNFNRGHGLEARDNLGQKYAEKWDKINILPGTNPWWGNNVSTEGTVLFEPVAFKLYELAGTPSSQTQYFQFRIIDGVDEASPTDQYAGDNWGLYIAIEQPEAEFLNERGLPDGNIFNMHGVGGASQRSQGSELPTDKADLSAFVNGYKGNQTQEWYEQNLNFESYFAWNAINLAVNNNDLRPEENVNYYHNQETGQWYTLPWDLDLTFEDAPHLGRSDTTWDSIQDVFNQYPVINQLFENRVREIANLLFDSGDAALVIDQYANVLTGGETSGTVVQANQALWDYHPRKNKQGIWYDNFNQSLLPTRDFESLVQYMKTFTTSGGYGYDLMTSKAADSNLPSTPTISYAGQGFALDDLTFETTDFDDPQGAGTFAALEWRVAEVYNPGVANYDPSEANIYEIEGTWESGELSTFDSQITVPGGELQVGQTYRARVRMMDDTGRFSHWSDPLEFVVTAADNAVLDHLRITEVMYNPTDTLAGETGTDNDDYEFIELYNSGPVAIDLSDVQFTDGLNFSFATSSVTSLEPDEYVVVVRNQSAFESRYGNAINIAGEFSLDALSNSGETIELSFGGTVTIHQFSYEDGNGWPALADGKGASMDVLDTDANYDTPANWHNSVEILGSPGRAGLQPFSGIVINEVLTHTDLPQLDSIELLNVSDSPIDISGWWLSDSCDNLHKFQIPPNTLLDDGDYIVFTESDFNSSLGVDPMDFGLNGAHGDELFLIETNGGQPLRYIDAISFGAAANGETIGRFPNGTGPIVPMAANTIGSVNSVPRVGPVVISEINYNPVAPVGISESTLEFVEIINTGSVDANLLNWTLTGANFSFLGTTTIAAGEIVVVVSFDPLAPENAQLVSDFRTTYGIDGTVQLVGGFSGSLSNGGELVQLLRPDDPPLDEPTFIPQLLEDEADYDDDAPWPTTPDGGGSTLTRLFPVGVGSDPSSWMPDAPTPGSIDNTNLVLTEFQWNSNEVDPADLPKGPQPTSWAQQRSEILSIDLTFNREVLITEADIVLTNLGVDVDNDIDVPFVLTDQHIFVNGSQVTIQFLPGELPEGVYQLEVLPTATDTVGNPLDGDGDGNAGGSYLFTGNAQNQFYRMISDFNGDEGVSVFDFSTFSYWFGVGLPEAPIYVDMNRDLGVSVFDFTLFANNFGRGITYANGVQAFAAAIFNDSETAIARDEARLTEQVLESVAMPIFDRLERVRPDAELKLDRIEDQIEADDLLDLLARDVFDA